MRWMRKKGNLRQGLLDFISYLDLSCAEMVEIGCYAGGSTNIFAKSGKFSKIIVVDPWKNGYDKNDIASKQMEMAKVESIFDDNLLWCNFIIKMKMTGDEAIDKVEDSSLDLVYIDGDHRYEAVMNDILKWSKKVKKGGYISGHDYYTKDKNVITDVRVAVDKVFGNPEKVFQDNSLVIKNN